MRTLSLFTGAAGLELGLNDALRRLGAPAPRTIAMVEGEAYAAANLVAAMAAGALDEAPVWSDVVTFNARPWRGCVDLVVGGYPCQPFSVAGPQMGAADHRHLWPQVARIVHECEPALCVFENVGAHLSKGFDLVASDLQGLGFEVATTLFTAQEVGAPHKRERLFILAAHPDRVSLRHLQQRPALGRHGVRPGGQAVADDHGAHGQLAHTNGFGLETIGLGSRAGAQVAEPSGGCGSAGDVADTHQHAGNERRPGDAPEGAGGRDPDRGALGAHDVGHTDRAWQLQPEGCQPRIWGWACDSSWWATERGLGRVAFGLADWVDRLRLCGNGVVPAQASEAIVELWEALAEHLEGPLDIAHRGS